MRCMVDGRWYSDSAGRRLCGMVCLVENRILKMAKKGRTLRCPWGLPKRLHEKACGRHEIHLGTGNSCINELI